MDIKYAMPPTAPPEGRGAGRKAIEVIHGALCRFCNYTYSLHLQYSQGVHCVTPNPRGYYDAVPDTVFTFHDFDLWRPWVQLALEWCNEQGNYPANTMALQTILSAPQLVVCNDYD